MPGLRRDSSELPGGLGFRVWGLGFGVYGSGFKGSFSKSGPEGSLVCT